MIKMYLQIANQAYFDDSPFMKYYLPIITIVGCLLFFYFGYKGIVKKKTISLFKVRGFSARESHELFGGASITGIWAVIFGIIYILLGILLLVVLAFPLFKELINI